MKSLLFLIIGFYLTLSNASVHAEELDLDDETTRINYSLGYQIGGDFKRQGVEMDPEAVVQGIRDALSESEPRMTAAEMRRTLAELKRKIVADQKKIVADQKKIMADQKKRQETEAQALRAAGKAFLEQNGKQEDVVTLPSGLQYRVVREGRGKTPGPTDKVTVHYRGTLVDGKEFDSSYKRDTPASFALNGVIKGWSEGLQCMKEGARWELFIPPELAYNTRGPLANQTLIFDVELIAVESNG